MRAEHFTIQLPRCAFVWGGDLPLLANGMPPGMVRWWWPTAANFISGFSSLLDLLGCLCLVAVVTRIFTLIALSFVIVVLFFLQGSN